MALTSYVIGFAIPPSEMISLNGRAHWAAVHRQTVMLRSRGSLMVRAATRPRFRMATLTVHVAYPDHRRRDVHNLMGTVKPLVDGMVDAGLLPDDDDTHLIGPDLRVWARGDRAVDETMAGLGHPSWLRLVCTFVGET